MTRSPTPIDCEIGKRLRALRKRSNISQATLGRRLGMSYQQIQKYENGSNRIAASTLLDLAGTFGVPTSYFTQSLGIDDAPAVQPAAETADVTALLRAFADIEDPDLRKQAVGLVQHLATAGKPSRRARGTI